MSLKTLKDLNEEFRKDNIPQRLSGDEFNDYWEEKLKAEAMKWIIYDIRSIDKPFRMIKRWMNRFNITEEDLKDG